MAAYDQGPLAKYNSLTDRHLMNYFSNDRMRRHLIKNGLITKDGEVVSDAVYRIRIARREHRRHIRDLIAQAIVHKALEMERARQIDIRKKIEEISKIELVRRVRSDRGRIGDEEFVAYFNEGNMELKQRSQKARNRSLKSQSEMDDCRLPQTPDQESRHRLRKLLPNEEIETKHLAQLDSLTLGEYAKILEKQDRYRINKLPYLGLCSRTQPKVLKVKKSKDSQKGQKKDSDLLPQTKMECKHSSSSVKEATCNCEKFFKSKSKNVKEKKSDLDIGHETSSEESSIPSEQTPGSDSSIVLEKGGLNTSNTQNLNNRKSSTKSKKCAEQKPKKKKRRNFRKSARSAQTKVHANTVLSLLFHAPSNNRNFEVVVEQQPNGGNTLILYRESIMNNKMFKVTSQRHKGFPFSLTFYIDNVKDSRISTCCEYKHKVGKRIGGPTGHFTLFAVEGDNPCFRCLAERDLAKENQIFKDTKSTDRCSSKHETVSIRSTSEDRYKSGNEFASDDDYSKGALEDGKEEKIQRSHSSPFLDSPENKITIEFKNENNNDKSEKESYPEIEESDEDSSREVILGSSNNNAIEGNMIYNDSKEETPSDDKTLSNQEDQPGYEINEPSGKLDSNLTDSQGDAVVVDSGDNNDLEVKSEYNGEENGGNEVNLPKTNGSTDFNHDGNNGPSLDHKLKGDEDPNTAESDQINRPKRKTSKTGPDPIMFLKHSGATSLDSSSYSGSDSESYTSNGVKGNGDEENSEGYNVKENQNEIKDTTNAGKISSIPYTKGKEEEMKTEDPNQFGGLIAPVVGPVATIPPSDNRTINADEPVPNEVMTKGEDPILNDMTHLQIQDDTPIMEKEVPLVETGPVLSVNNDNLEGGNMPGGRSTSNQIYTTDASKRTPNLPSNPDLGAESLNDTESQKSSYEYYSSTDTNSQIKLDVTGIISTPLLADKKDDSLKIIIPNEDEDTATLDKYEIGIEEPREGLSSPSTSLAKNNENVRQAIMNPHESEEEIPEETRTPSSMITSSLSDTEHTNPKEDGKVDQVEEVPSTVNSSADCDVIFENDDITFKKAKDKLESVNGQAIKSLTIRNCELPSYIFNYIANKLELQPTLKKIELSGCEVEISLLKLLSKSLEKWPVLEILKISNNVFVDYSLYDLVNILGYIYRSNRDIDSISLKIFDISNCALQENDFGQIIKMISDNTCIDQIVLDHNHIDSKLWQDLIAALQRNSATKSVSIKQCITDVALLDILNDEGLVEVKARLIVD